VGVELDAQAAAQAAAAAAALPGEIPAVHCCTSMPCRHFIPTQEFQQRCSCHLYCQPCCMCISLQLFLVLDPTNSQAVCSCHPLPVCMCTWLHAGQATCFICFLNISTRTFNNWCPLQLSWRTASASSRATSCKCRCMTQALCMHTCCHKVGCAGCYTAA
jgi:hypothetical protein